MNHHPSPIPPTDSDHLLARWTALRATQPSAYRDLTSIWARVEALTLITNIEATGGHLDQLRRTVGHLGGLLDSQAADATLDADLYDVLWPNPDGDRVFPPGTWHAPTGGRWEAVAPEADQTGRPTFEAVIGTCDGLRHSWWWDLYRPDGPYLEHLAGGPAHTLAHARHQAERLARQWRDETQHMERQHRLQQLRASGRTFLACDSCHSLWPAETVLRGKGCPNEDCTTTPATFEGYSLDELATVFPHQRPS